MHENEKAIWIDKKISYRLGVASKLAGKTIKQYVTEKISEAVDKDLSAANIDLELIKSNSSVMDYEEER